MGRIIVEYLGGPNVITGVLISRGKGVRISEGDVTVKAEIRYYTAELEDSGRSPEPGNADGPQKQ